MNKALGPDEFSDRSLILNRTHAACSVDRVFLLASEGQGRKKVQTEKITLGRLTPLGRLCWRGQVHLCCPFPAAGVMGGWEDAESWEGPQRSAQPCLPVPNGGK